MKLDSSFFQLEDPFRGRKSQDAMRFFTGFHSEEMTRLDGELLTLINIRKAKRETVKQLREFSERFDIGTEHELEQEFSKIDESLEELERKRKEFEAARQVDIHPTDELRDELRELSRNLEELKNAKLDSTFIFDEVKALRSELITSKTKAIRAEAASELLDNVSFLCCPLCASDISDRLDESDICKLCHSSTEDIQSDSIASEAVRLDINQRIEEIDESLRKRSREISKIDKALLRTATLKTKLDDQLALELRRYDSSYVESLREADKEIATLQERRHSLERLKQMPDAINSLEKEASGIAGETDVIKTAIAKEHGRIGKADSLIEAIEEAFLDIMLSIRFPGVTPSS